MTQPSKLPEISCFMLWLNATDVTASLCPRKDLSSVGSSGCILAHKRFASFESTDEVLQIEANLSHLCSQLRNHFALDSKPLCARNYKNQLCPKVEKPWQQDEVGFVAMLKARLQLTSSRDFVFRTVSLFRRSVDIDFYCQAAADSRN